MTKKEKIWIVYDPELEHASPIFFRYYNMAIDEAERGNRLFEKEVFVVIPATITYTYPKKK